MGLKDDVKQRRHEKIKSLLQQSNAVNRDETSTSSRRYRSAPQIQDHQDRRLANESQPKELDPELAWKTNPNPWASWEGSEGSSTIRSFVRGPSMSDERFPYSGRTRHTFRKELQWKLAISMLLFALIWALFQYNNEWTVKGQAFVKQALTDEIDFAAAAAWYKQTFAGAPSFIPIFEDKPNDAIGVGGKVKNSIVAPIAEGSLVSTFAELLNGIELAGPSEAQVVAAETGKVILVTNDQISIMIQHANNRVTVYGGLGEAAVKVNDWVEAGDPIGKLQKADVGSESLLYFAVKEKERYIDPLDVISLD